MGGNNPFTSLSPVGDPVLKTELELQSTQPVQRPAPSRKQPALRVQTELVRCQPVHPDLLTKISQSRGGNLRRDASARMERRYLRCREEQRQHRQHTRTDGLGISLRPGPDAAIDALQVSDPADQLLSH